MGYVELHCHSCFSFLDGASTPEDLVRRAVELSMEAIAITDHNGLYGAVRLWKAARKAGIRPIFGAELTLSTGHHLTALARNRRGWGNLCRIISIGGLRGSKGKPNIELQDLLDNGDGLILLSGCSRGPIASSLLKDNPQGARLWAERLARAFGEHAFFVELQNHLLPHQGWLIQEMAHLAYSLGLGAVATGNVHYARKEDRDLADVLRATATNTPLSQCPNLLPNGEFYLRSPEQMEELFQEFPEMVSNSLAVANLCQVDLDMSGFRLPDFPVPAGHTPISYLRCLCLEGAKVRYGSLKPEVLAQLDHELQVIGEKDLAPYFLMVWDIARFARERGIPLQGRGSAAGSLVAYLLGITRTDPLAHNLLFERFLSPERRDPPDIDIDVSSTHREEVIQYVYGQYGQERTAMACTFVTYGARSAVRATGKALGLPPDKVDKLAKALQVHSARDLPKEMPSLMKAFPWLKARRWQKAMDIATRLADLPRHTGIHVGGMVVTGPPLLEILPLERATMPGRVVVQFDKDDLEDLGLIKLDILGLKALSVIHDAKDLLREARGIELNLEDIPLDDPAVYALLKRPDTVGAFQVESRAQIQMLPEMQPQDFNDLIVQISLIRPGPIQGNMVHPYLRRRRGEEATTYVHPLLEPILRETLGVVVFQEQVMKVATEIAGFSPGQADTLRRALGRNPSDDEMEELRDMFIKGALARGLDGPTATAIFQAIAAFAGYGFPKSHAAAFARIAYETLYLKAHYPAFFYVSLLNNQPAGFYPPEVVVQEALRHGVKVLPPDVNLSRSQCTLEGEAIRLGLGYISGLGPASLKALEREREKGPFTGLEDLCRRTRLPRDALEALILAGALDAFGGRRHLLADLPIALRRIDGQMPLHDPQPEPVRSQPAAHDNLLLDYALMGLSPCGHISSLWRSLFPEAVASSELPFLEDGQEATLIGLAVSRQRPPTAKGLLFIALEDDQGLANVTVPPHVQRRHRIDLMHPVVLVRGRVQWRGSCVGIMAENLQALRPVSLQ
jgi:error-prone DNA polymerase